MKSIFFATDLSARSDRAFARAVQLTQQVDARLTIVHIVDDELPSSIADDMRADAERLLLEQVSELQPEVRSKIDVQVIFGDAYEVILSEAARVEADLVVLGAHRERPSDFFRGTTIERVVRKGQWPVLVAKARMRAPYRNVIVGVDFSTCSRRAIEFSLKLIPDGEFHLVHAYQIPFRAFLHATSVPSEFRKRDAQAFSEMVDAEMLTFMGTLGVNLSRIHQIMQEGGPREVIRREARRLKPDLVVVGTHGRTGIAHALLGSVAEDLLNAPPCDVLAVKAW